MKCAQCGALIREASGFCDACGARVKVSDLSSNSVQQNDEVQEGKVDINLELIPANMRAEIEEKYKDDPILKEQIYNKIIQMMIQKQQEAAVQGVPATPTSTDVNNSGNEGIHNAKVTEEVKSENIPEAKEGLISSKDKRKDKASTNKQEVAEKVTTPKRDRSKKSPSRNTQSISEPTNIFSAIVLMVKNPVLSTNDLEWCMSSRNVISDAIKLVVGGAIMTAISFNVIAIRMIHALMVMFGDFFILMGSSVISSSNAEDVTNDIMQTPFMQDTGFKIIMYPLLSHIILIVLMSLMIIGVYKVIKKQDVTFNDCIMCMLTPLSILFVGKILVFLLAFVSGTLAAYAYVLLMPITVVVMIFQLINLLGVSTFNIYTVPILYIVSALVRNTVIMGLIKGSMSAYTLYF